MDESARAEAEPAPAYGAFAPDLLTRLLLGLARHTPLGRGGSRTLIRNFLRKHHNGPIDGTMFGTPVRCYLDENRCEWKAFLNPALFDPEERALVADVVARPGAVFLDIGANIGVHTLAASRAAAPDARLIAFEPHPVTFGRLAFNLAQCGHKGALALQVALSDKDGYAMLGGEDLSLRSLVGAQDGPQVRTRPLVDCLAELGITRIDAMKIDVEGHEGAVLGPFLEAAPDSLVPKLVIIEHLGTQHWDFDCIAALQSRGMVISHKVGNNTILIRTP
jgi:FkbM family methyltransferase